jgi:hypothetical protein
MDVYDLFLGHIISNETNGHVEKIWFLFTWRKKQGEKEIDV